MVSNRHGMTLRVGSFGDTELYLHYSLLAALLLYIPYTQSTTISLLIDIVLFGSVLSLHEVGHQMMLRRFGVRVKQLILHPFGSVVALERELTPGESIRLSIGGIGIHALFLAALMPIVSFDLPPGGWEKATVIHRFAILNFVFLALNAVPAKPLDGGGILEALLKLFKRSDGEEITAGLATFFSLLCAVFAIYFDQILLFVPSFAIFVAGAQALVLSTTRQGVQGFIVDQVMVPRTRLECFEHGTKVGKAAQIALTSLHPVYPVTLGSSLLGILVREDLLRESVTGSDKYVGSIMERSVPTIESGAELARALELLQTLRSGVLAVMREGQFLGLILEDRLFEFLLVSDLRRKQPKQDDLEWPIPL